MVIEGGRLYPHHNLYYILSREWPLAALQAVLMSGIAHLFVRAYSTKMHGGCLRFQAQYLRRIRLPRWHDVPPPLREQLLASAAAGDPRDIATVTGRIYQLTPDELEHLTPPV